MRNPTGKGFGIVLLSFLLVYFIDGHVDGVSAQESEQLVLKGHQGGVNDVRFSPDGAVLASCGFDGTVRLWDVTSGKELRILKGHEKEVFTVAFSTDGTRLATSGFDETVQIWDVKSGSRVRTHRFDSYATALDISSKGMIAVGLQNATVNIFDIATGRLMHEYSVQWPVYSLAFSHDGAILATGGPIQLWNTETWKLITRPRAPGGVFDLEFAPDRSALASAHIRGVAYIWSDASYERVHAFDSSISFRGLGPKGSAPMQAPMPIAAVAFSPDGKSIASAGADRIVRLWSVNSGELTREFKGHTMSVVGLSFKPDGEMLASASLDGTVRIWDLRLVN